MKTFPLQTVLVFKTDVSIYSVIKVTEDEWIMTNPEYPQVERVNNAWIAGKFIRGNITIKHVPQADLTNAKR